MATKQVRTPGSRLGDDLYRLYLVALGWLFFPVYGEFFAFLLPTSNSALQWAYPIAAVAIQLGWIWSGFRGGPMSVSRASIIHELGAAVSPRSVLAPQLLRQAVAWGAGGALVGGVLTSIGDNFAFSISLPVSVACFLLLFSAVMWASVTMIAVRASGSLRMTYLGVAVIAGAIAVAVVVATGDVTSNFVLLTFAVLAVVGAAVAWIALDEVPVPSVWQRAGNLEAARSAMLEVDLHRMMIDLRGAGDNRATGTTRAPTRWLAMWRCLAPIRHAVPWSGFRVATCLVSAVLLLLLAPIDQGVVLLAIGAVWLVLGYEITRGIASVADHVSLLLHYPHNSFRLLASQLAASTVLGTALMSLTYGWWFLIDEQAAVVSMIIAAMGVVGGALQARLGSPDTTHFIETYGLANASAVLWARAAAGPLAVVVTVVLVFHGFALQPLEIGSDLESVFGSDLDVTTPARLLIGVVFVVSVSMTLRPLEKVTK